MLPPGCELWGPCPPAWGSPRAPSPQPEPTLLSAGVLAAPGSTAPVPRSSSTPLQEQGQGTTPPAHATTLYCHSCRWPSQFLEGVQARARAGVLSPHTARTPPRLTLSLSPPSWPPRSSLTASLLSCSGAGRQTKGAEHASVLPASFPAGCGWQGPPRVVGGGSGHTSMPGARPSPSACTRSSLSPLFSVRRTAGRGDREWGGVGTRTRR